MISPYNPRILVAEVNIVGYINHFLSVPVVMELFGPINRSRLLVTSPMLSFISHYHIHMATPFFIPF